MRLNLTRGFVAVGTGALLVFLIVIMTGGFVIQAGPLRFSATRWLLPLLITAGGWVAAVFQGRAAFTAALHGMSGFLERHSQAFAVVLAAAAIGVGLGFGTYAASGSDAAGYVSEAALLASGRLAGDEPLARRVGWPDVGWAFSPLGYRPGRTTGEIVPTYPIGLPLMMATASTVDRELAPYVVVPLLGGLAVFATYLLGRRLHSGTAGAIAAALLCTSPIFLFQVVQPMSDVPATGLLALAVLLAIGSSPLVSTGAGVVTGLALLTRPNLLPLGLLIAALTALWPSRTDPRRPIARLLAFVMGTIPAAALMLAVQWRLYGGALSTGYGALDMLFSLLNIPENVRGYSWRLWRGEAPALSLAALSVSLILIKRQTRDDGAGIRQAAIVAAAFFFLVSACYLPYGVFAEWFYLRFLLPALPFVFVFTGALLVHAVMRVPTTLRGPILLTTVVVACSVNIVRAESEQAFNLRRFEARYRIAGRYLEAALPPEAIVVAVQQSGSARHYAQRPIVRWDQLRVDLDAAVATLRTSGRYPVLLIEDWETTDLRARFPASEIARLDWQPRADFGDETRVRLFDPADRRAAPDRRPTDRVH